MTEDGQLLRQYARQGSQAAFSQLVARHLNLVYSVCRREVGDAALAEDVTQVVFLLLARKAPMLAPDTRLTGWLFQTARFACKNALRREMRRKLREKRVGEQALSENQPENALWDKMEPGLNDALALLGAKNREAVLLRFSEGLSFSELGAALGISEDAARMRLNRAVERLRRCFARDGITLSSAVLVGLLAEHTAQAAPVPLTEGLSSGMGMTSSTLQTHFTETLKAMTMAKLKLIAIIGASLAFAVTLPFVTRAQNHARRIGQQPLRGAGPDTVWTASRPAPLTIPRSLHVVYSILSESDPAIPAEYWIAGPSAARWTTNGSHPQTIATDGRTWTELIEPPNAGSVIKANTNIQGLTRPSLVVERANSWVNGATGVYGPGVLAGEIPFLGFGQPGKVYRDGIAKITRTADGWEEHCRVPYGYGSLSTTGKPALVNAVLTYDRHGRLVRFRRNRAGDIWETSVFSNFITKAGMEIPGRVQFTVTDESGGHVVTDTTGTDEVRSFDRKPRPLDWFTMQRPPVGTFVQDYRFANHKPTPGLAGDNSSGVLYQYSGQASLDEESRAQYRSKQNDVARMTH